MTRHMLAATLAAFALSASAASALDVPRKSAVSTSNRADSGRYGIFRESGRRVPGWTPGFMGDAVRTADGYYIGSVDEVYRTKGGHRVLVVGIVPEAQAAYGIHTRFIYVRVPAGPSASDGTLRLPMGLSEVARRF